MSTDISRRTFLGIASAVTIGVGAGQSLFGQSGIWVLTANVVTMPRGLGLRVKFTVDFMDNVPLYLEIVDLYGPTIFQRWIRIADRSGDELVPFGPFDMPDGRTYLVSVVDGNGQRQLLSPVVQVDVPALPGILS
jgi:hypothetical protein